MKKYVISI